MRAAELNWSNIRRLSPTEWPRGVLEHMGARVILALSDARDALPPSHAFMPSPVVGGHVRTTGNTANRHYAGNGRLSDATDFFVAWPHAWDVLTELQRHPNIGGIGIYTDMMLRGVPGDYCMFHIDMRPNRLLWVGWRESREQPTQYVYHNSAPRMYHRLLYERGK